MKDLFLTPRGDLAIEDIIDSKERLEINFITSQSNALVLNFFVEDMYTNNLNNTSLLINFNVEIPENNKEFRIISDATAIEQAIKIRLSSSLGSLRGNTEIGSKIETVIHSFVDDSSVKTELEKLIKLAIEDLIPNPIIKITKPTSKYLNYSTALKITIIDNDNKYNIQL